MRVAVFFLYVFFLLLKGGCAFSSVSHSSTSHFPVLHIKKNHQLKSVFASLPFTIVEDTKPDEDSEYMVKEEVENEDASSFLTRKYKLLAGYFLALLYLLILRYLYSCFNSPPPFWGNLSYIYIKQGALRI